MPPEPESHRRLDSLRGNTWSRSFGGRSHGNMWEYVALLDLFADTKSRKNES